MCCLFPSSYIWIILEPAVLWSFWNVLKMKLLLLSSGLQTVRIRATTTKHRGRGINLKNWLQLQSLVLQLGWKQSALYYYNEAGNHNSDSSVFSSKNTQHALPVQSATDPKSSWHKQASSSIIRCLLFLFVGGRGEGGRHATPSFICASLLCPPFSVTSFAESFVKNGLSAPWLVRKNHGDPTPVDAKNRVLPVRQSRITRTGKPHMRLPGHCQEKLSHRMFESKTDSHHVLHLNIMQHKNKVEETAKAVKKTIHWSVKVWDCDIPGGSGIPQKCGRGMGSS